MSTIRHTVLIQQSPQAVFDFLSNPAKTTSYHPYIKKTLNIVPEIPCLGQTFDWIYLMAGVEMKGSADTVEFVSPQKYTITTTGDITSKWEYLIEPAESGCKLTLTISYEIKSGFLGLLDTVTLGHFNQNALEEALNNLKAQLELS